MKKLALSLIVLFSLHIKAEAPEATTAEQTEETTTDVRVSDIQTQVPVLMGYFISSLGSGLGSGIGTGLVRSAFAEIDQPYDILLHTAVLSQALWDNCDKEQEALRCAEIAARCNENIMKNCRTFIEQQIGDGNEPLTVMCTYGLYQHMEKFQPEQFEVNNRAYTVAATVLGFAAGAYVGTKIGNGMYNGFGWLWTKYYPAAPVIGENYIDLGHTIPRQ